MAQWLVFVTEHKEDQDQLIRISREQNWRFKPSVSCYSDDAERPIPHPRGDAHQYRRRVCRISNDMVAWRPT